MRLALLINFVAPYRVALFEHLRERLGTMRVFISTPMERDRHWTPDWGSLDVVLQRTMTVRRTSHDLAGFARPIEIHMPYDTIPRLQGWRPDVVLTIELGLRSLQAVLYKRLHPSVPLVLWCMLSEHTERSWGRSRRLLRRFIVCHADRVIVNGGSGARYIANLGVAPWRITQARQPVDVARFTTAGLTRQERLSEGAPLRLLHVGQLIERKGVLPFARAISAWARRHPEHSLELTWLGDGHQRAQLEAMEWPHNLRSTFLGNLPYDEVPAVYAASDALVFATLSDEWGLVVNEALASGLPVLGSIYAAAVEELVREGETGWLFDPLREGDLDAALDRMVATPHDRLAVMRDIGRCDMAELTPEATAARIAAAVTDAVESSRGRWAARRVPSPDGSRAGVQP